MYIILMWLQADALGSRFMALPSSSHSLWFFRTIANQCAQMRDDHLLLVSFTSGWPECLLHASASSIVSCKAWLDAAALVCGSISEPWSVYIVCICKKFAMGCSPADVHITVFFGVHTGFTSLFWAQMSAVSHLKVYPLSLHCYSEDSTALSHHGVS